MSLAEMAETLDGTVRILNDANAERNDSRIATVQTAIKVRIESLDEMWSAEEQD